MARRIGGAPWLRSRLGDGRNELVPMQGAGRPSLLKVHFKTLLEASGSPAMADGSQQVFPNFGRTLFTHPLICRGTERHSSFLPLPSVDATEGGSTA